MPRLRFDRFELDPEDRTLKRDGAPVEVNARYLDALALLAGEPGKLVSKTRFMDEVWRGVPVTDEALTQCIRTLRKLLGDDAARPRFIETVPKHGYRFIAVMEGAPAAVPPPAAGIDWRQFARIGGAGTLGGGAAGAIGGLLYGFGAAVPPGSGAASALLVLLFLTTLVALLGGAGVSFGIAAAGLFVPRPWSAILGGAAGGLVVGAVVKLIGLDAFDLLFGQAPTSITGAGEGILLGGGVGVGAWLASRTASPRRAVAYAALAGATAGVLIPLIGGRLMSGSLDALARQFPGSRLSLDPIGALVGETGFGPIAQAVTGGVEGALFGGCIVGAMLLARGMR